MLFLPIAHQLMKASLTPSALRTFRVYYCVTPNHHNHGNTHNHNTDNNDQIPSVQTDITETMLSVAIGKALTNVLGLCDDFPVLLVPISRPCSYNYPVTNPSPTSSSLPSWSLCAHFVAIDFRKLNAEVWIREGQR